MYYWKSKTETGKTFFEEMIVIESVSKVRIATAFLSHFGVDVIKRISDTHQLHTSQIELYISSQFDAENPGVLLEEVSKLCDVKILLNDSFHPKVYLFQGKETKLIFGSSNLTNGGFVRNIEFNYVGVPSKYELNRVLEFFDFCEKRASNIDDDIIKYYKSIENETKKLYVNQKKLSMLLAGYVKSEDPFCSSDYCIDNSYFDYNDYETFFTRNTKSRGKEIQAKRENVQKKMLIIHKTVFPSIKRLGLCHHKRKENITSIVIPHAVNFYKVGWIGVRYGKTPAEVDALNFNLDKDDAEYGFQKHGCLQFSIHSTGFEIAFFLAVRNGAVDREWLHQDGFLNLLSKQNGIERELNNLKGNGFIWTIWNDGETASFEIDNEPAESFCDWFMANDREGCESSISKFYEPDDVILLTLENICSEIELIMEILLPLYNLMVWRPKLPI